MTSVSSVEYWDIDGSGPTNVTLTWNAGSGVGVLNDYSFTHANPVKEVNLYRLKMIDLDEKYTYSSVCQVSFDGTSGVVIYPNPASDNINIQTDNPGTIFYQDGTKESHKVSIKTP